jgi:hypothetical protein
MYGPGLERRRRCDNQDAAAARQDVGQEAVRELGQRLDVDAQQAERGVEISLGEQAKGAEAGVVTR